MKRLRVGVVASHPIQTQTSLYRELAARPGVDLEVLFLAKDGAETYVDPEFGTEVRWDTPLLEGFASRFVPMRGPAGRKGGLLHRWNPALIGLLRSARYDVLLVNGWASGSYLLSIWTAPRYGTRVLLRGEANGLVEPTGWRGFWKRTILRRVFARCAGFAAVGSLNRRFYERYGIPLERVHGVPYTVDNPFFLRAAAQLDRRALRAARGISEEEVVFLFCGKLIAKKRPGDVLAGFLDSGPLHARLIFAGSGELEPELRRQSGSDFRIEFAGFQNQRALCELYAMADALVIASDFEPWGLVVNEAMCFGLPVIASSAVGAVADLVRAGENGFVFAPGDRVELARAMQTIAGDAALRERMRKASRERIATWGPAEAAAALESAARRAAES